MNRSALLVVPMLLGLQVASLRGQGNADDIPAAARQRLDHHIGVWDIRTEYVDRDGNVARTVLGVDTARYIIPGRVVELTTAIDEVNFVSKAWVFYSIPTQEYTLTSVDARGELWILKGGLDEYVITSPPKTQEDGRVITIRFTHIDIEEDSFTAVMEFSYDDGRTWGVGYRQYLRRRTAGG